MNEKQCPGNDLKETIVKIIGKDRPFMDVPDVAEEIAQNILPIIEQHKTSGTTPREVVVMVYGGVADISTATPGTTVTLRDYDVEGRYESDLKKDEFGEFYIESIYEF